MISLIYFLAVLLGIGIYYMIPQKLKVYFLLVFSWGCYFVWNSSFFCMILILDMLVWFGAILISRIDKIWNKGILLLEIMVLVSMFFLIRQEFLISKLGLSFYSFQAIGYLVDSYREKKAEKSFVKTALFLNFFPIVLSGPIERGTHFIRQIEERKKFCIDRIRYGCGLFLWGLFQKLVIADRCAVYVNQIYNEPTQYNGVPVLLAIVLYSLQIYSDFAGYSDMAVGIAECFGYHVIRNFSKPYFSKSIKEFWSRWHISLTKWLTDYIYKPLGGSRKGEIRTYCNIIIVFFVSGIWHGNNVTFVIWGILHAVYQCFSRALTNRKQMLEKRLKTKFLKKIYAFACMAGTFVLVSFAWIFFRSDTLHLAGYMITHSLCEWGGVFHIGPILNAGLDLADFVVLGMAIVLLMLIDQFRGRGIYNIFKNSKTFIRWGIIYLLIFSIIIFGVYGPDYNSAGFLYSQF